MGDMSREPSMEEILSSIRRVIARDEAQRVPVAGSSAPVVPPGVAPPVLAPPGFAPPEFAPPGFAQTTAASAFADAASDADADDILELTEMTDQADRTEAAAAHSAPAPLLHDALHTAVPDTLPDAGHDVATSEPGAGLLSDDSLSASARALGSLAAAVNGDAPVVAAAATVTTVDALVEAALRPMLKEWLDANLSSVVERLVAREIAKITGARP